MHTHTHHARCLHAAERRLLRQRTGSEHPAGGDEQPHLDTHPSLDARGRERVETILQRLGQADTRAVFLRQLHAQREHEATHAVLTTYETRLGIEPGAPSRERVDGPEDREGFIAAVRSATLPPGVTTVVLSQGRQVMISYNRKSYLLELPATPNNQVRAAVEADIAGIIAENGGRDGGGDGGNPDAAREREQQAFVAAVERATPQNMRATVRGRSVVFRYRNRDSAPLDLTGVAIDAVAQRVEEAALRFRREVDSPRAREGRRDDTERDTAWEQALANIERDLPEGVRLRILSSRRQVLLTYNGLTQLAEFPATPDDGLRAAVLAEATAFKRTVIEQQERERQQRALRAAVESATLPAGVTVAIDGFSVSFTYREQRSESFNLEGMNLREVPAYITREATAFKQRIDASPDQQENTLRSRINTARQRLYTLADTRPADAGAALREMTEQMRELNTALAALRRLRGPIALSWDSRLLAWDQTKLLRYAGDNTAGTVQLDDIRLIPVPDNFGTENRRANDRAERDIVRNDTERKRMPAATLALLKAMGTVRSGHYTFEEVTPADNDGYHFRITVRPPGETAETWYVSATSLTQHRYPDTIVLWRARPDGKRDPRMSILAEDLLRVTRAEPTAAQRTADSPGTPTALTLVDDWARKMDVHRRDAQRARESEDADAAGMSRFDLPKNRPIGCLQLGSAGADDALDGNHENFATFTRIMRQQGYAMTAPTDGRMTVIVDREPADIVRASLQSFAQRGIRDVYLSISAHGSNAFVFPGDIKDGKPDWTKPRLSLTYAQLMGIFREFPQMHVTINTVACFGAWQDVDPRVLRDVPGAEEGRITAFTHCNPRACNISGMVYDRLLNYYLSQGLSYGAAHTRADRATQAHMGYNPRVRRSSTGTLGYSETAREPGPRGETLLS